MFDLKKKLYTGISLEEDVLRIATIGVSKDKITVTRLQTAKLVEPIDKPESDLGDFDIEMPEEDDASIFGIDEEEGGAIPNLDDAAEEDWDMADESSGAEFIKDTNASLLAGIFTAINPKNINVGLTIPFANTYFQIVGDIDLKNTGKRKLKRELHDRLEALYGHPVSDDQMVYNKRGDDSLLVASIESQIPTLRVLDESVSLYPGKIFVRDISADEALLIGLVRTNYELLDHQYTCIVHVEDRSTHVIFLQGNEFHSILPVIAEGSKTSRVVRTIFSKILFEVDRGKIPTLDRIVLTGDTVDGKLTTFLSEQFLDVEVTPFEYDGNKFEVDMLVTGEDYRDYAKAIAAAWAASGQKDSKFLDLSLVPKYVQTRQQVFKLAWHGMILLGLIALTPIFLNQQYQKRVAELNENQQTVQRLDQQIREARAIADVVDRLSAEYTTYRTRVTLLDTLSFESAKWSRTLRLLNGMTEDVNSVWFTTVQADERHVVINGTSLYRDRIPRISNSFHNATIQQVTEREFRGVIVYDFTLLVTSILQDRSMFSPEKVRAPEDLLLLREQPATQGQIRQ